MTQFLQTYNEVKAWLWKHDVQNHIINDDLSVDVRGSVFLDKKKLSVFPIQFGTIDGNFYCQNNELVSLLGSPIKVNGMFICSDNELTSLEFSPERVGSDFRCSNNPIQDLSLFKTIVYGSFECENCPISSLVNFKAKINKDFIHSWLLNNIDNAPEIFYDLKEFYKVDNISHKIKTQINYDELNTILEKLRLEANTTKITQTKKSVKI